MVGSAVTGTVSAVDLATGQIEATISTGLHPTGMAFLGQQLLVANTYSDTISVIDTSSNQVTRTINLGLPIGVPGAGQAAYGAAPNSIAVDAKRGIAYVALYNANAIAVVNVGAGVKNPVVGMIPVAYAPCSVVLDETANHCWWPTTRASARVIRSRPTTALPATTPIRTMAPSASPRARYRITGDDDEAGIPKQPLGLMENIKSASGGSPSTKPVAIPAKIGDPSLIKHVFLIIRENRTYDQILGDVAAGNGDPSLAVFGGKDTPNAHALVNDSLSWTISTTQAASRLMVISGSPRPWRPMPTTSSRLTGFAAIQAVTRVMHSPIERGIPVRKLGKGFAGEDLRRICRERKLPAAGRVDRVSPAGAIYTRLAELRDWSRADAVLPGHDHLGVFCPGRI